MSDTDFPKRNICVFPYFILEWTGFFDNTVFVYLEPQDVLTFIL